MILKKDLKILILEKDEDFDDAEQVRGLSVDLILVPISRKKEFLKSTALMQIAPCVNTLDSILFYENKIPFIDDKGEKPLKSLIERNIKILDNTTNRVVVQTPERNYPGIVLQGDTLNSLNIMANSNEPFQKEQLKDLLDDLQEHYNKVCIDNDF